MTGLWPDTQDDPLAAAWDGAERDSAEAPQGEPAPDGWREWLEALFPYHVRWGFAPHHEDFWRWVDSVTAESTPAPYVLVLARGGAKSSSAELAAARVGVTGRRKYVVYVRGTQKMADKSVANIAALLESDAVARHYPEHASPAVNKFGSSRGWRRNRLVTAGGFVVDALGLDAAARGAKFEAQRPDFFLIDDVDEKHDSPATTAKKIETLTTSILPAGAPNVAVLCIQNLITPDGIFTRMVDGRADYLARRVVNGPHPALLNLQWEWQARADGQRRGVILSGTPTWQGQDLSVCQHQMDSWGPSAFLKEAQHQVTDRSEALALNYDAGRHEEALSDQEARQLVGLGSVFGGLDFGAWRFAFTLWAADRAAKVHQIAEYFSQQESLEERARVIHALCLHYGAIQVERSVVREGRERIARLRLWGDSANQTDIMELNAAFRRIESPLRCVSVGREGKLRAASVERINDNLDRNALALRKDVLDYCAAGLRERWKDLGYQGVAPDISVWLLNHSAASTGVQMTGSRLLWEILHWTYPVPRSPEEPQDQDPDDKSADGGDLVASSRYALMSWWKAAKPPQDNGRPKPNVDTGLEKTLERLNEAQRHAYGPPMGLVRGKRREAAGTLPAASARPVASTAEPVVTADYRAGIAALLGGIASPE